MATEMHHQPRQLEARLGDDAGGQPDSLLGRHPGLYACATCATDSPCAEKSDGEVMRA